MKNEIKIYNRSLMNRIDKLMVYVIIKKSESNEEPHSVKENDYTEEYIKPMELKVINEPNTSVRTHRNIFL